MVIFFYQTGLITEAIIEIILRMDLLIVDRFSKFLLRKDHGYEFVSIVTENHIVFGVFFDGTVTVIWQKELGSLYVSCNFGNEYPDSIFLRKKKQKTKKKNKKNNKQKQKKNKKTNKQTKQTKTKKKTTTTQQQWNNIITKFSFFIKTEIINTDTG